VKIDTFILLSGYRGSMRPYRAPILLFLVISSIFFSVTPVNASSGNNFGVSVTIIPSPPNAKITSSVTCSYRLPLDVTITDLSTGAPYTSWQLDFGDGSPVLTTQNPSNQYTHRYTASGSYVATLTVSNAGGSSSAQVTIVIDTRTPSAVLGASTTSGYVPLTVTFTDKSKGNCFTSWQLDFGDGTPVLTTQDPSRVYTHTYTRTGTFPVKLSVSNPRGSSQATIVIKVTLPPKPVADFVGTPTSGRAPFTVRFTDRSTNNPTSWAWAFGDGGTSGLQNPPHEYANTGFFSVTLTATNAGGSGSTTKANYIAVCSVVPTADFSWSAKKLAVSFADKSTNYPTSWRWTFGDGSTSTLQNPSHTYTTAGTRTVTLTATNFCGSSAPPKSITITVSKK
jgi:PKD repeat protein